MRAACWKPRAPAGWRALAEKTRVNGRFHICSPCSRKGKLSAGRTMGAGGEGGEVTSRRVNVVWRTGRRVRLSGARPAWGKRSLIYRWLAALLPEGNGRTMRGYPSRAYFG